MQLESDVVVLVHGLCGSRLDMWPIARRLKQKRFQIQNWSYRSLGNRIETHAARFGAHLSELDAAMQQGRIHIVTHSMGGVIARTMFSEYRFENLGRVVMLAPPHRGSHTARKMSPLLGWLTPSLKQLSDAADSFVNQLPNSFLQNGIEFGIVEAAKDRVIAQGAVQLDGHRDFAQVNGHHGILTWYSHTIELVENFLLNGQFKVAEETESQNRLRTASAL